MSYFECPPNCFLFRDKCPLTNCKYIFGPVFISSNLHFVGGHLSRKKILWVLSRYAPEARLEVNYFSWFFQASTPSLSPSASPSLSSGHSRKNPPPPPVSKPPGPPGGGGPGRPNMKPPPPPPVGQPPSGGPPPPPSSHYRGMLGTTRSLPIGHFHKWRKTIIQGHNTLNTRVCPVKTLILATFYY